MIDWTREQLVEWFEAHRDFRRTRSYGALFRVPKLKDKAPRAAVVWRGVIEFDVNHSVYLVDRSAFRAAVGSIQEDKSAGRGRENNFKPPGAGPPGPAMRYPLAVNGDGGLSDPWGWNQPITFTTFGKRRR